MKKTTNKFYFLELVYNLLYRHRSVITIISLLSLTVFAFFQFYFLRNWDMLVRILNANYLFHNGYYFESERAFLESMVIGLSSFILGSYAVYFLISVTVALFAFAMWEFSKTFKTDFYLSLLLLLSPFLIFYGIKNGSDLFVLSFIILFFAYVKRKSPLAGLFLGLAFLSKYYALLFFPLIFFMFRKNKKDSVSLILAILVFIAVLIPYFIYNFVVFGNFIFPFAQAFLQFSADALKLPYFVYTGLMELIVPGAVLSILILTKHKFKRNRLLSTDSIMLFFGLGISFFLYYDSNWLMTGGMGMFRFALPSLIFSSLLLSLFLKKSDILWLLPFVAVSFVIAVMIMQPMISQTGTGEFKAAVSDFQSVYGTTNCTVSSNFWVELDYYGLPAMSISNMTGNYSGMPVVNLGAADTTYPLVYHNSTYYSRVYIYGGNYCTYHKVITDFITQNNYLFINGSSIKSASNYTVGDYKYPYRDLPISPCYWLFSTKYKLSPLYSLCQDINGLFSTVNVSLS